jgi:non-specific serine/threonine protein kinase
MVPGAVSGQSERVPFPDLAGRATLAAGVSGLPEPLTPLIGRERETAAIHALLQRSDVRLVTLTGPGGIGKTRVALSVARSIALDTTTYVVFIPLAAVAEPAQLGSTIGAAFRLAEGSDDQLGDRLAVILGNDPLLLVLDNVEHLVEAAPLVPALLQACPSLTILTTSRRPLSVSGEHEVTVPPLDVAPIDSGEQAIVQSPACRLFVDRAGGLLPHDPEEALAIAEICRRLEGVPLAIELAAARTRIMRPGELLERLDRQLPLLTGGPVDAPARLRTMRDAIAWSYALLDPAEQRLLRSLSVFSGGFTLSAVESVAPEDAVTALERFSRLVEHHLVHPMIATGARRFTMLETVREFALEALQAAGEEHDARSRHADWLIDQLGHPTAEHWTAPMVIIHPILEGEDANLRVALEWSFEQGDPQRCADLVYGLLAAWWCNGLNQEALDSLQRLAAMRGSLDPALRAEILCRTALFAFMASEFAIAHDAAQRALVISRQLGDPIRIARSLHALALATADTDPRTADNWLMEALRLSRAKGDNLRVMYLLTFRAQLLVSISGPERALEASLEALAIAAGLPDTDMGRAQALSMAAWSSGMLGDLDAAVDFALQGEALSRQVGYAGTLRPSLRTQGEVALLRREFARAAAYFQEALQSAYRDNVGLVIPSLFIEFAQLAQACGDWTRAARLFGAAASAWTRFGFAPEVRRFATWNYDPEPSRESLGEEAFARIFAIGMTLPRSQAYADAMAFVPPASTAMSPRSPLTRRETQVLQLVALGKRNREIAEELFVNTSTIDTHLSSILGKLDARTRLAAVTKARERGLIGP